MYNKRFHSVKIVIMSIAVCLGLSACTNNFSPADTTNTEAEQSPDNKGRYGSLTGGTESSGFNITKTKGYGKKREMMYGLKQTPSSECYDEHQSTKQTLNELATENTVSSTSLFSVYSTFSCELIATASVIPPIV